MRKFKKDDIGPSKGLAKFIHKLVWVLLFPIRRPAIFFPLLILAYLIPTFIGAKPAEVHLWYYNKIKGIFSEVKETVAQKGSELIPESVKNFSKQTLEGLKPQESNSEKVIDLPSDPQAIRRQMFEKAQGAPESIDIMKIQDNVTPAEIPAGAVISQEIVTEKGEPTVAVQPEIAPKTITESRKLDLIYLVTPQEFSGKARVNNANELIIEGNTIFLYGIYVDPNTSLGIKGKEVLNEMIGDNPVKCIVEAYTKQGFATGLCFVNGKNINHEMVDKGISQDVALER